MTPKSQPEKSEWMQIAESDNSSSSVRKVDKRLTWGTLVSVGAIAIAGSLFANANEEQSAVADITPVASSISSSDPVETTVATPQASSNSSIPASSNSSIPVATSSHTKVATPAIAQLPKGGGDDDDDDDEEHEGRGERHDRHQGHDEDDDHDDDHEDDD